MNKLIILPNLKFLPKGLFLHLDNNLLNLSLCDILLYNNIYISHICGKFGKCKTCKIKIIEGLKSINKINYEESETLNISTENFKNFIYRLSCQVYLKNKTNLIIHIYNYE